MSKRKSDGWISQRSDGRWNVGYGGKRTVRPTRAAALECLREMRIKGDKTRPPKLTGTLAECVEWWAANILSTSVKPTTLSSYYIHLRTLLHEPTDNRALTLGELQARTCKKSDVQYAVTQMAVAQGKVHSATVALGALSRCCEYYIGEKLLNINPCDDVRLPKMSKKQIVVEMLAYEGPEMKAILSELDRRAVNGNHIHKHWYVFVILANTGLRIGEMLYLKWKHIDFDARTISVEGTRNTYYSIKEEGYTTSDHDGAKTKSSTRVIPINAVVYALLTELRDARHPDPEDYIALTTKGRPLNQGLVWAAFNRVLKNAGVEKKKRHGVHSLRHTFATRVRDLGAPIKVVSALLGHSSVATTMNIYVHDTQDDLSQAVNRLAQDPER